MAMAVTKAQTSGSNIIFDFCKRAGERTILMLKRMKKNKKGFTLAELLIVVAIIGVLVAISIPIFTNQLDKARDATSVANLRSAYAEFMADQLASSSTTTKTYRATIQTTDGNLFNSGISASDLPFTVSGTVEKGSKNVTFSIAADGKVTAEIS